MSDHPRVASSLGELMGLGPCTGTPNCGCVSHGASGGGGARNASPAPGGSRNASHAAGGTGSADGSGSRSISSPSGSAFSEDGNSTADTAMEARSDSEDVSTGAIPVGVPVQEWSGLGTLRIGKCEHGRYAILKKCWGGVDTGRRFLGCPVKDVGLQCAFVEWLDPPNPQHVQASFKKLWRELSVTREVQAAGQNALIDAYKAFEENNKEKEKLKEDADRAKRVAEEVFHKAQRAIKFAIKDKNKLLYLVYVLLGLICMLLGVIIVKN